MTIQINTDKNITSNARLEKYIQETISDELSRFSDYITRIEVHLADENGKKEGGNDKRCMIEARLKNKQPIAVTSHASAVEKAVNEALSKLKSAIASAVKK
jgi:ribosome-associated translation inhibitor RaiA